MNGPVVVTVRGARWAPKPSATPRRGTSRTDRRLRTLLTASICLSSLVGATSCSSTASLPATADMRQPHERDGGIEVTVPALWADDATGTSGTEPARIWTSTAGSALFTINLADIEAQGAGAQWTAASAAAAAVGSMVSGIEPGRVDVDFDVTGPIDGPSAGGILTVGVIAALLDAPIRGDMTMTGTISPDGSIGPVGGIALKLQAAAEQGYRTILLPMANMSLRNPQTNVAESAAEVGRRLGVEVKPVGNVQEAFTLFTDGAFAYPSAPAFQLPSSVQQLAVQQSNDLIALVQERIDALPPGDPREQILPLIAIAQAATASGDTSTAYGVAMQAMNMASREVASEQAQAQLATVGTEGAHAWLADWVLTARARSTAAMAASARLGPSLGYEQQIALPNAMSWLPYNLAILAAVQQQLYGSSIDAAQVDRFARILADVDAAIDVYQPNQQGILEVAPSRPSPGEPVVATYLSDYTTFLIRAGQAQQDYAQQVLLGGKDPAQMAVQNDVGLLLPVVIELRGEVEAIPVSKDSLAEEVLQATTAVTYYIATTSLIAALQNFGVDEFGIGADPAQAQQAESMRTSVQTAKLAVDQVSALLGQRDLDASLPVWAAAYGAAAAEALRRTPQAAAAKVLALNELYFDAVTVFMLQSGPVA